METWLKSEIEEMFRDNQLSSMLGIQVSSLAYGEVSLRMPIASGGIHANTYGFIHGGSLFTLVDSAMGIAGLTTGNLVVTGDINIRFITNSKRLNMLTATGWIIHKGSRVPKRPMSRGYPR